MYMGLIFRSLGLQILCLFQSLIRKLGEWLCDIFQVKHICYCYLEEHDFSECPLQKEKENHS